MASPAQMWVSLAQVSALSDDTGGYRSQYYDTIQCADIDGDEQAELLARTPQGLQVWSYASNPRQWSAPMNGPGLSDAQGWSQPQYYSTIQCADIDGDGQAELLARSSGGISVWKYSKTNTSWSPLPAGPALSDADGWNQPQYYSTIQYADIDGDGQAELIVRGSAGISMSRCDKSSHQWTPLSVGPALSDASGWNRPQYYRTIQCADIDGDGQAELLARGSGGIGVWKYSKTSNSWSPLPAGPALSDADNWNQPQYYSTIQYADIDGDGQAELIVRGSAGISMSRCDKSSHQWTPLSAGPALSDADNWNQPRYYSTIQCADIDGDRQAELLAYSSTGIAAWKYSKTSNSWNVLPAGPILSNDNWSQPQYYSTIQYADIDGDGQAELIARSSTWIGAWDPRPVGLYPYEISGQEGGTITLCVEPSAIFQMAFFRQDQSSNLTPLLFPTPTGSSSVAIIGRTSNGVPIFQSPAVNSSMSCDSDWGWPQITFQFQKDWTPGAYVAVIYRVNAQGKPLSTVGKHVQQGEMIAPVPPFSDSMCLFLVKASQPSKAKVAYILPIATYHGYNWTGGGCFYGGCPPATPYNTVTMRRPGGGLGAQLREPPDFYQADSPRQQFAHWDAPFIAWLLENGLTLDFYTDMDLDNSKNPLFDDKNLPRYRLLLSVGHHEYWSGNTYNNIKSYINAGGNYAVFGGNTCWGKVAFDSQPPSVKKIGSWSGGETSQLIGLSYAFGSARWGDCNQGHWTNTERENVGYLIQSGMSSTWVFNGTQLKDGQTFGNSDHLVGYECDGTPSPVAEGFVILAKSPLLLSTNGWQDHDGQAAMALKDPNPPSNASRTRVVFNCGTTDWTRVLTDPEAVAHTVVQQITSNVVKTLAQ